MTAFLAPGGYSELRKALHSLSSYDPPPGALAGGFFCFYGLNAMLEMAIERSPVDNWGNIGNV